MVSLNNFAKLTDQADNPVITTEAMIEFNYAFSPRTERVYSHRSAQTSRFVEVDSYLHRLRRIPPIDSRDSRKQQFNTSVLLDRSGIA